MSAYTPTALGIPWQPGQPCYSCPTLLSRNHTVPSTPSRRCKDPPVQLASGLPNPQLIPFKVLAAPPRCCPKMSVTQLLTFRAMVWRLAPSSVCKEAIGIHCPGQKSCCFAAVSHHRAPPIDTPPEDPED